MKTHEIRLFVECDLRPWERNLLDAIEEARPDIKVVASARTITCPICGESAEIVTHWGRERKRWWQFWKTSRVTSDYYFSSEHHCYKEYAQRARPGDVWWKQRTGTVEALQKVQDAEDF